MYMVKQVIFSFSLDSVADLDMIGELDRKKNRSSFIRRCIREKGLARKKEEEFQKLYDSYEILYKRYMKELGIKEYIVPGKNDFRK